MIRQHSEPSPIGYYNLGIAYLNAAKSLALQVRSNDENERLTLRFEHPIYHLYGQSLELFLKAFLLKDGASENKLKNSFGHNLQKCYKSVSEKWKLKFDSDGMLKIVTENLGWLHKEKFYSYLFTGSFLQIELSVVDKTMSRFRLTNSEIMEMFGHHNPNRITPEAQTILDKYNPT